MFEIEADCVQVYTCKIFDKDEQRIKDYIKNNPEKEERSAEKILNN